MSETTIRVPAEHVEAIRRSLHERRDDAGDSDAIESLLDQLGSGAAGDARTRVLVGSRAVLWSAVYDSLCAATERLADDFNDYWRGSIDPESARSGVTTVAARLELLVALGAPPAR